MKTFIVSSNQGHILLKQMKIQSEKSWINIWVFPILNLKLD